MRKKIIKIFIFLFFASFAICNEKSGNFAIFNTAFCAEIETLNIIKQPANRLGLEEKPENNIEIKAKINTVENKSQNKEIKKEISAYERTYSDISLKKIATEVFDDTMAEEGTVFEDLGNLWVAAAQNSETMQYAIYKLSNPDENKPEENMVKKILKPVANFSAIAGTAFASNPFVASGAMVGSGLLGAFSTDDKDLNYRFTKVNDANMVLLVQRIENLQKKLLYTYLDYKTKQKICEMALENAQKREQIFKSLQNSSKEEIIVADVYLRNAQNALKKAQDDFSAQKKILEQMVGEKAVSELN